MIQDVDCKLTRRREITKYVLYSLACCALSGLTCPPSTKFRCLKLPFVVVCGSCLEDQVTYALIQS